MENAHLRMGILEYDRQTEKTATRVRVRVSHYIGEEESAHLVSVFGNDSDVGAITAAVYEQARFRLTFPDGKMQEVTLGEGATCCRGSISIPGRKQSVRHMIALSEEMRGLNSLVADLSAATGCNRGMDGDRSPARPSCNTGLGRSHDEGAHREQQNHASRWHRVLPSCGVRQHRGST